MGTITRNEFDEWKQHPVTLALLNRIKEDVITMQDMLVTVEPEDLRELQGRVKACLNLLSVEYESLYE